MNENSTDTNWRSCLALVVASALAVYCLAHRASLTNTYVINDDVRQQIFWMQKWQDPELFQDDILAQYACRYVPWGVKLIYYTGSFFMDPVQFSKVVGGVLYVLTAVFMFGLGRYLRDDLTGLILVGFLFVSTNFMYRISGGLSRAFAFPLMTAYLWCLARQRLTAASVTIFLQSLLVPYIMLVCLATHCLFQAREYALPLWHRFRGASMPESSSEYSYPSVRRLFLRNLPVIGAVLMIVLYYVVFEDRSFGSLATWSDMSTKIEYTDKGRYPIIPVPSLIDELKRPFELMLPFNELGVYPPFGTIFAVLVALAALVAVAIWIRRPEIVPVSRLWIFAYLLAGSIILYVAAYAFLMKLFLPRRYMEYPLTVFYAVLLAVGLRILVEMVPPKKTVVFVLFALAVVIGIVRLQHIGITDYSDYRPLCRFLAGTPKNSFVAGPPDVMDNVVTFAGRRALVTYELSHTWYLKYWNAIKKRTFDFYRAYYSSDPEEISKFARDNQVDYLVVREKDFPPSRIKEGSLHFEPFESFVRNLTRSQAHFAALDRAAFPVVFEDSGLRVLRIRGRGPESGLRLPKCDGLKYSCLNYPLNTP